MEQPFEIFDFKDEAEWLNGRMNGIGGSDASAVIGMNPYKSNIDLFEEKIGRRFPEDISGKACVIYGKYAEEPIRELFKLDYPEYKVEHHEFRILRSIEHPFMQASLDGELTDQDEVYKLSSLTAVLDGPNELVREGANANEILIPKMSMQGLADYNKNTGYVAGDVTLDYSDSAKGHRQSRSGLNKPVDRGISVRRNRRAYRSRRADYCKSTYWYSWCNT